MISVVIPIYNTARSLPGCIDSVLDSTFKDFEVILVNDGSTDDSPEICREYCRRDVRVRLIDQENRGVSEARNRGIGASRGDWVVFVDSDDEISRDFLEMVAAEETADVLIFDFTRPGQEPGARLGEKEAISEVHARRQIYFGKEERTAVVGRLLEGRQLTEGGNTNLRSPCGKAYRRSVLQEHSVFFCPDVFMGEDILFNAEIFLQAQSLKYISVPVYSYTVRMGSVTHRFVPGLAENYFVFQRKLRGILMDCRAFPVLERAYYADALENAAYVLIKEVFSPYHNVSFRKKRELCRKMREDSIYREALKYNFRTGILPRRVLLFFFQIKCYGIVSIISRLSFFCIERIDKRRGKH